jgi:hypothetical protein
MEYASIVINSKICKAFYRCGRGEEERETREKVKINGEEIEYVSINEVIKYLGAPIGARRGANIKFSGAKFEKFKKHLRRIKKSGLKVS